MLRVRDLEKQLGSFAIRRVSFDVADGAYFVLLGASGVGKTVVLEMLAGVTAPDCGTILWGDTDLTRTPIQGRRMGLVYQEQALFPHLTVRENIAYGLRARRLRRTAVRERVHALAEDVGVTHLLDRWPATLSGGEAQRVALARALATEPRCLLLDEPITSLDTPARSQLRALLRGLHRKGYTVIHVTHDYEEALSLATHVAIMEQGTVVQSGPPRDIFHHPKSEFVARFVGIRNFFPGRLEAVREPVGALRRFISNGIEFAIVSEAPAGPGCVILRSEDITVSTTRTDSSAQNVFRGAVIDLAPARLGIELTVDIGVEVAALITAESVERLALACGQEVWLGFKATAARFIEE